MNENQTENAVKLASRRVVKKITAKIVCGKVNIEKLVEYIKSPGNTRESVMPLFGVIGLASDFTSGNSDFGAYVKLLGQFKAVNHETGEEFRSGAAILPGSGNDMVYGALRGLGDAGGSVEFAFKVGVQRDEDSATGYVYVVEQVYQQGQVDALAQLESRLSPASNVSRITDAGKTSPGMADQSEKATGTNGKKK